MTPLRWGVRSGTVPVRTMGESATTGNAIADRVAARLALYLGPHTGRVAVKTFALKALGRGPETLTLADVPALQQALRPMLRTFVGRAQCEIVLTQIARELGA
jgi:hypothetical protein